MSPHDLLREVFPPPPMPEFDVPLGLFGGPVRAVLSAAWQVCFYQGVAQGFLAGFVACLALVVAARTFQSRDQPP